MIWKNKDYGSYDAGKMRSDDGRKAAKNNIIDY